MTSLHPRIARMLQLLREHEPEIMRHTSGDVTLSFQGNGKVRISLRATLGSNRTGPAEVPEQQIPQEAT